MQLEPIRGLDAVVRELKDIDPNHVKAMRKEIITEIKPLYTMIKQAIPNSRPMSGMVHNGRTRWNQPVRVTGKMSYRRRGNKSTLVSIRTVSPAVEMADMAGRVGKFDVGREGAYSGFSAEYNFRGSPRRHVLNGQGRNFVDVLDARVGKKASRFVWPSVEKNKDYIVERLRKILDRYAEMVNRRLM